MYRYCLASPPRFLDNRRVPYVLYLLDYIQFTESVYLFFGCRKVQQFIRPSLMNIANVAQPVIDQSVRLIFQRGFYASAPVMTTHNNMFDF